MKKLKILNNIIIILLIVILVPNFSHATTYKNIEFNAISSTDSKPVSNLEVLLYKIGIIGELNEPILNSDITNQNINISNLSENDIKNIAQYVKLNYSAQMTKTTDLEGGFVISGIQNGVYVILQNNQIDTCKMQPLVTWISDLTENNTLSIKPKIETLSKDSNNNNSTETKEIPKEDELLPQTGVIELPIPILAVGGIVVFTLGWYLIFISSKKKVK